MDQGPPQVSVCFITYNHTQHVAQAMESVLSQRTSFPWEIVVGDDASSDGTREQILEYARLRPDLIRPFCRTQNIGMVANIAATLKECRGGYVALLEGDDYWNCETKLQAQKDLLDGHPETTICFHQTRWRHDDGQEEDGVWPDGSRTVFDLKDVLRHHFVSTSSMMLRGPIPEIPDCAYSLKLLDWILCILVARRGNIRLIPEEMSTYRIHAGGSWSARRFDDQRLLMVAALDCVKMLVDASHQRDVENTRLDILFELAWWAQCHDPQLFRQYALRYLATAPRSRQLRRRANLLVRALAPGLLRALDRLRGTDTRKRPARRP
jgi:glycosyltransferase involved in cell wall biosynthesis